jgi:hypothetical protein
VCLQMISALNMRGARRRAYYPGGQAMWGGRTRLRRLPRTTQRDGCGRDERRHDRGADRRLVRYQHHPQPSDRARHLVDRRRTLLSLDQLSGSGPGSFWRCARRAGWKPQKCKPSSLPDFAPPEARRPRQEPCNRPETLRRPEIPSCSMAYPARGLWLHSKD